MVSSGQWPFIDILKCRGSIPALVREPNRETGGFFTNTAKSIMSCVSVVTLQIQEFNTVNWRFRWNQHLLLQCGNGGLQIDYAWTVSNCSSTCFFVINLQFELNIHRCRTVIAGPLPSMDRVQQSIWSKLMTTSNKKTPSHNRSQSVSERRLSAFFKPHFHSCDQVSHSFTTSFFTESGPWGSDIRGKG